MERRPLGKTGMQVSVLGFGASSLGAEFREVDLHECLDSVHVALDRGMNLIDTSPYYGRGQSEVLLGYALRKIPRERYFLCTKLGRYAPAHFDFSARRVGESIDISLERMGVEYLDIALCHDVEFVGLDQIVNETIPALREIQKSGKVRFIGISGYPMKIFREILAQTELDLILSYNHFTLQNDMLRDLAVEMSTRGVGVMNAAPFSARLLTGAPLPVWHKAPAHVRDICAQAAAVCVAAGSDLAKLAIQYSIGNQNLATCITGSANPQRIGQWVDWINEPIDTQLLAEVQKVLKPIHNWFYVEGRVENNDTPLKSFA